MNFPLFTFPFFLSNSDKKPELVRTKPRILSLR
jgi:hypothetical protein